MYNVEQQLGHRTSALEKCLKPWDRMFAVHYLASTHSLDVTLYVSQTDICKVNNMRYELFRMRGSNIDSGQLPSCQDSLYLHAARVNYRAALWYRSLVPDLQKSSPLDCKGWVLSVEEDFMINWMTVKPSPERVIAFLFCKCKKICKCPTRHCLVNGLPCTQACSLQVCDNMKE